MRMQGFGWAFIACFFGLALIVVAAEPNARNRPDAPPTPALPTRVTVTKSDGKMLAGTITAADHDGINLTYGPKSENLHFAWSEVKSISNGLTRDKAIAQWKQEHADKLCAKCNGERTLVCTDCKGTGIDPKQQKECQKCHGTGSSGPCPTPGCKEGKIDCPKPCLKLSQGTWKKMGDVRVREFKTKNGGTHSWSEGHLGELIVIENGDPVNKGPCPTCHGTTKIDDPACKGKGHKECPDCHGIGFTGPVCPTCDHGNVKCEECKGTGLRG
jgi:hypothetical protein